MKRLLTPILLFLALVPVNLLAVSQGDSLALVNLYNSTGGANWTNSWNLNNPVSTWYGVELSANGTRVITLNLKQNNLNGTLTASLHTLDHLRYLNVKINHLTGAIPWTDIAQMDSLRWLLLAGRIDDPRESDTFYYPGKEYDPQETNDFTDTIGDIASLSKLEFFELSWQDHITGGFPATLGSLSNLRGLYLNYLSTSGDLPPELGNLSNLVNFQIQWSGVTGAVPESFGQLTNLTEFRMEKDPVTGPLPDTMKNLTKLETVSIESASFSGSVPAWLYDGTLPNIHTLLMTWNDFTGTMPKTLDVDGLYTFGFSGSDISGSLPDSLFVKNPHITVLDCGWMNLSGPLPPGFEEIPSLRTVYLNDNNFTGPLPDLPNNAPNLGYLNLNNNNFSGSIPNNWADIDDSKLKLINITNNMVEGSIPAGIATLNFSNGFNISNNKFVYDDIIPFLDMMQASGASFDFTYSPQKNFGEDSTYTVPSGGAFTIDYGYKLSRSDNVYQWMKDGVDIPGQTSNILRITNVDSSDEGVYTLRVTNPNVPALDQIISSDNVLAVGEAGITTGDIEGTVTDSLTGAPLSGAEITALPGDYTTSTNQEGFYSFQNVPEGDYTVTVFQSPYTSRSLNVGVHSTVVADFTLSADWHFTPVTNTGDNATISLPATSFISLAGDSIAIHDEIGVFTPRDSCVGSAIWTGQNLFITAWGADTLEAGWSGFLPGEPYRFKIWEFSSQSLYDVQASYSDGDSTYSLNGISTLDSLYTSQDDTLPAPVQIAPADGATNTALTPTFKWEPVDSADYYILDASGRNPSAMVLHEQVVGTSYTPETALQPDRIHDWRVHAVKDGVAGKWSPIWIFTTGSAPEDTLTLTLKEGWNQVSSNIIHTDTVLTTLFQNQGVENSLVIMKNARGEVYWPEYGIDQIGSWKVTDGYQIKMDSAKSLSFKGKYASPDSILYTLSTGWNLLSYIPCNTHSPQTAFQSIWNRVIMIKDGAGNVCYPAYNIYQIDSLHTGYAYWLNLSEPTGFAYTPSLQKPMLAARAVKNSGKHLADTFDTGDNATLLVRTAIRPKINGRMLTQNDEIRVYTQNGLLAGIGEWKGKNLAVTVWGDNPLTDNLDGFQKGEALEVRLWDHVRKSEYKTVSAFKNNKSTYASNALIILQSLNVNSSDSAQNGAADTPKTFSLDQNLPNPFYPTTRIQYEVPVQSQVSIKIYNLLGEEVTTIVDEEKTPGKYAEVWDGRNKYGNQVSTGQYFCRMVAKNFVEVKKMLFVKEGI